jgi:RNA polymerase II subunit A C-terminal domain phosphatase SSU72
MSTNPEKVTVALVCLSNLNRSMESHALFNKHGYLQGVRSFGTGRAVVLPGESIDTPNVRALELGSTWALVLNGTIRLPPPPTPSQIYAFGEPYAVISADLSKKNRQHYLRKGMIQMAERDAEVKPAPERWHDSPDRFHVVITFDRRAYESVCEGTRTPMKRHFRQSA